MEIKTQKTLTANSSQPEPILNVKFWLYTFCISCIIASSLASQLSAKTNSEYLDPTELLSSNLQQNVDDPNISPSAAKIHSLQANNHPQIQANTVSYINFAAQSDLNTLRNTTSAIIEESKTSPAGQLLKASISILQKENPKARNELQDLIKKINSIKIKDEDKTSQSNVFNEVTNSVPEPQTKSHELEESEQQSKVEIESKPPPLPYKPIASQTLQLLVKLSSEPNQVDNPFELAELLFLSNHVKEAAILYQEALDRTTSDGSISAQRKAWILFQLANCLRDTDSQKSQQVYRKLINEFPDSPWVEPAKSRVELIDWYLKNEPQKIISSEDKS